MESSIFVLLSGVKRKTGIWPEYLNINYEYRYKGGTSEDALFIAVFRYCLQEARY